MAKFASDDDGMVSMELDDESKLDLAMPSLPQPDYPWGLKLCLTSAELEKLGIDVKDASVGDYFHIVARACVTSISSTDGPDGPCNRLEAQIEEMAVPDQDDDTSGSGY